jgi:O-antigen ligase
LGDSFLRWYLLGLFGLLWLVSFRKLDFSWVGRQTKLLQLWGGFLFLLLISFFFTHHLPLSLGAVAFYSFAFLVFVLARSLSFSAFKVEHFSFFLISVGVILSFLSLFFLINRPLAALLPAMNLIYATYGHNHLAAFLLLVLPLSWREVYLTSPQEDRATYLIKLFSALILTFTLLISFGRTALFLGLLQLSFIWFFYLRKSKVVYHRLLKRIFLFVLVALVSLFIFKLVLSLQMSLNKNFVCPFPTWLSAKLCKPLGEELRPLYFSQAMKAIKDYPLTGFGPDTFQLVNKKYQQLPHVTTSYVHNHFLQTASELGILAALVFVLLIWKLYWQAGRLAFAKNSNQVGLFNFRQALFIGAMALLINAFFDFDWSYLGIFSLTLFYLGLILRHQPRGKIKGQDFTPFFKLLTNLMAGGLVFLVSLYLLLEILIRTDRISQAFAIFPFFKEHTKIFETAVESLTDKQRKNLAVIYRFSPSARVFKQKQLTEDELKIREQLYLVDPWRNLSAGDITWFLANDNYQAADQNLTKLLELVENAERQFNYSLGYMKKSALMEQRLVLADYYLAHGESSKAARYYLWAQSVEPWILDHRLPLITEQVSTDQLAEFLLLAGEDPASWGNNHRLLVNWHLRVFAEAVNQGDEENAVFWFELTDQRFEYLITPLWSIGSRILVNSLESSLAAGDLSKVQQQLAMWSVLWPLAQKNPANDNSIFEPLESQLQSLANQFLDQGEDSWLKKTLLLLAQIGSGI